MSRLTQLSNAILGSATLWGVALAVGAYSCLNRVAWVPAPVERLFMGHWSSYLATTLFFIALAALGIKSMDLLAQRVAHRRRVLPPFVAGAEAIDHCGVLLSQLETASSARPGGYLVDRIRQALRFVERRGGAESLDDELRYLAARDRRQMLCGYRSVALVLVLLFLLGLSGTVEGVTQTGSSLDTTLLAIYMSAVLLVVGGAVATLEARLLAAVDARVDEELGGRFQRLGTSSDPQVLAVRRMADAVIQVSDRLVHRQAELWQTTIQAAHAQWNQLAGLTLEQTQTALAATLAPLLAELVNRRTTAQPSDDAHHAPAESSRAPRMPAPPATDEAPRILRFDRAENKAA